MKTGFKLSHRLARGFWVVSSAAALAACAGESLTNSGNPSNPVSTIIVSPVSANVTVDETLQLSAVLRDGNGGSVSGRPISWSTEDGNIATVTPTGLVAGTDTGTATITASSEGKVASATVRVRKKGSVDTLPPPPPPPPPGSVSCLTQAGSTITLTGARSPFDNTSMASNTGIDATTASWTGTDNRTVRYAGGSNVCWSGGRITGLFPDGTSWDAYHDAYSMVIRNSPATVIEGVRIHNYGDGPNFDATGSDGWIVRGNHLSYIHDDCVSNDFGNTGLVDDNLMDGCYNGYSSRSYAGAPDNHTKVVTFRNNLMRLQDMPTGYAAPGHGKFWKLDRNGIDPRLALHDNIFRVDTPGNCCGGIYLIPPAAYLAACSNNIIVWLGAGEFPEPVPSCFTVTRDKSVWDNAVANWKARHPNVGASPAVVAAAR